MSGPGVRVRGNATAEELAAALTVLTARATAPGPSGGSVLERWRRARFAALHRRVT